MGLICLRIATLNSLGREHMIGSCQVPGQDSMADLCTHVVLYSDTCDDGLSLIVAEKGLGAGWSIAWVIDHACLNVRDLRMDVHCDRL